MTRRRKEFFSGDLDVSKGVVIDRELEQPIYTEPKASTKPKRTKRRPASQKARNHQRARTVIPV